jgi:hypothetical protein
MTLHLGRYFGFSIRRMTGSDGAAYLTAVIWFPRDRKTLGYAYPSIRWF